jgi:5'-3' exonuclease
MSKNILLIDSSYYNFYRFFATKSWYNRSPDRVESGKDVKWVDNSIYMKTYEKMWFETLKKLCKMFCPDHIVFARDGNDVWRYNIYPEYKANRREDPATTESNNGPGPVFKYTNEHFHPQVENSSVVRVSEAEADDIIAVAVNYYRSKIPDCNITIISGDHDLLQLSRSNVQIYNLKGKKFTNITCQDPYESKLIKILAGDPSDNIKSAFPRCGKVTASKLAKDMTLLKKWVDKHGAKQYNLNCMLVDFSYIPEQVKQKVISKLSLITI